MRVHNAICAVVVLSIFAVGGCGGSSGSESASGITIQPALALKFNDRDRLHGKLGGQIEIRPAMDESGIQYYRLLWTDAGRNLIGDSAVAELEPKRGVQVLRLTLPESVTIPDNAAFLQVVSIGTGNKMVKGPLWEIKDYIVEAPEIVDAFDADATKGEFGGYLLADIHFSTDVNEYRFYWADAGGAPLPDTAPLLTVSADQWGDTRQRFEFATGNRIPEGAESIVTAASDFTDTEYYSETPGFLSDWAALTKIRIMGKYQLDSGETVMEVVTTTYLPDAVDAWGLRTYVPDSDYSYDSEPDALGERNLLVQTSQFDLNSFLENYRNAGEVKLLAELTVEYKGEWFVDSETLVIDPGQLEARIAPVEALQLTATETRSITKPDPRPAQLAGQFLGRVDRREDTTSEYTLYWADEQHTIMAAIENASVLGEGPYLSISMAAAQVPAFARYLVLRHNNNAGSFYGAGLPIFDSRIQQSLAATTVEDSNSQKFLDLATTVQTNQPLTALSLFSLLRSGEGRQISTPGSRRVHDSDTVTAAASVLLDTLREQPDALVFLDNLIILEDWYGSDYRYREDWYVTSDLIISELIGLPATRTSQNKLQF